MPRAGPIPSGARTVVPGDNIAVFASPDLQSPMVGRVSNVPLLFAEARPAGNGCRRAWFQIAPAGWVCGMGAELRSGPAPRPISRIPEPISWSYGVSTAATVAYDSLEDAETGRVERGHPWARWQGFAVRGVRRASRQQFVETMSGQFIPRGVVSSASRSEFHGVVVAGVARGAQVARPAWVLPRRAGVYATAESAARGQARGQARTGFMQQRAAAWVLETRTVLGRAVVRVAPDRWVRAGDLRILTPAPPPPDLEPRERWIDVDLDQQIMAAYEGDALIYATLTSSGAADTPTPTGTYRIWSKRVSQSMGYSVSHAHVLAEVPYVQFFDHAGRALHGVYWHGDFGRAHSHGCLNLSFQDARWMFEFTTPQLPDGWRSVITDTARGTRVRVRRVIPPGAPTLVRRHHRRHPPSPAGPEEGPGAPAEIRLAPDVASR